MNSRRIIYEWLRDSAIGFLLLVGGFILAELVTRPFLGPVALKYPVALCIGLIPFLWFAHRRKVARGDWWDYLAWTIFLFGLSAIQDRFPDKWSVPLFAASVGLFGLLYQMARTRALGSKNRE